MKTNHAIANLLILLFLSDYHISAQRNIETLD